MKKLIPILFTITFCNLAFGFTNVYPRLKSFPVPKDADVGDPLILTPLIESGKIDLAREKAMVQSKEMKDVGSYAGYFTVNKEYNSNMFFWFFPAQIQPETAPVILWLQGGPGDTSLIGLFTEHGPFSVTSNNTLKLRKYSWNVNHHVIYVDSPVGTGYSFTDMQQGYATSVSDVVRDLHSLVTQFFQLFPELRKNELYISGESYAGKYVPALAYEIQSKNIQFNLKGLSIGNGWTDPVNQLNYADYLYQLGLIDSNGREQQRRLQDEATYLIRKGKYMEANLALAGFKLLFKNLTGLDYIFNFLDTRSSDGSESFDKWVQKPEARKAIHVGNVTFEADSKWVKLHLMSDIARSVAHLLPELLRHYRILIYNGQLDIVCAYPLTENYLLNLDWAGAEEYKVAMRKVWWVGKDLAGYSKTVRNLTEVLVRNAGHSVPAEQPAWAWDLITRFTRDKQF